MDSPLVSSLFRSLFRQRACLRPLRPLRPPAALAHRRHISLPVAPDSSKDLWQPRSAFLQRDRSEEFGRYPMVTAKMLATRTERPKRVKMLVRDFIDGGLSLSPGANDQTTRILTCPLLPPARPPAPRPQTPSTTPTTATSPRPPSSSRPRSPSPSPPSPTSPRSRPCSARATRPSRTPSMRPPPRTPASSGIRRRSSSSRTTARPSVAIWWRTTS